MAILNSSSDITFPYLKSMQEEMQNRRIILTKSWDELSMLMSQYHSSLVLKQDQLEESSQPVERTKLHKLEQTVCRKDDEIKRYCKMISELETKLLNKDAEIVQLRVLNRKLVDEASIKDSLLSKVQTQMAREALEYSSEISALKEILQTGDDLSTVAKKRRRILDENSQLEATITQYKAVDSSPDTAAETADSGAMTVEAPLLIYDAPTISLATMPHLSLPTTSTDAISRLDARRTKESGAGAREAESGCGQQVNGAFSALYEVVENDQEESMEAANETEKSTITFGRAEPILTRSRKSAGNTTAERKSAGNAETEGKSAGKKTVITVRPKNIEELRRLQTEAREALKCGESSERIGAVSLHTMRKTRSSQKAFLMTADTKMLSDSSKSVVNKEGSTKITEVSETVQNVIDVVQNTVVGGTSKCEKKSEPKSPTKTPWSMTVVLKEEIKSEPDDLCSPVELASSHDGTNSRLEESSPSPASDAEGSIPPTTLNERCPKVGQGRPKALKHQSLIVAESLLDENEKVPVSGSNCQYCLELFTDFKQLEAHELMHIIAGSSGAEKRVVNRLNRDDEISQSTAVSASRQSIDCFYCEKRFSERTFFRHILTEHSHLRCSYCSLIFKNKTAFREHLPSHREGFVARKNIAKCGTCGTIFTCQKAFKKHYWQHFWKYCLAVVLEKVVKRRRK